MPTYTTNYNLKKPGASDNALISDINGNMDTIDSTLKSIADAPKGPLYLTPTVTTTGVLWSVTASSISAYSEGLMVAVLCPEATATGLKLKINSLAEVPLIVNAATNVSTRYAAGSVLLMTYRTYNGTAQWVIMDYDANTDTKVRQYQATNNVEYAILARYNTTDKSGTYEATYSRFTPQATVNPSTGKITAVSGAVASGDVHLVSGGVVHTALSGKQAQHTTLTITIATSDWSSNACTKSATGVTASNTVIVSPAPASISVYGECGVYCSAQGSGTLSFACSTTPSSAITVNVVVLS